MPTTQNDEESSQCDICGKWKTAPSRMGMCKNWFHEECSIANEDYDIVQRGTEEKVRPGTVVHNLKTCANKNGSKCKRRRATKPGT
jgi:hypothetical protein